VFEVELNKLKNAETRRLIENAFRDGSIKTTGTDIDKILPPVSRFGTENRMQKKQSIIEKLLKFFDKFFGIV
jgi:type I restriction enzyme R subunit